MDAFYGFVFGMIIGLVAAAIIATLLVPDGVEFQHISIDDQRFDCITWREELMCDKAEPQLSLEQK